MARHDAISAAVVLLFAAASMYEASQLPFGTVRSPGQGFFPWWLGLTLALLSLVLLASSVTARSAIRPDEARGRVAKVVALLAVLIVYVVALEPLGYPLCTFLLVLFMLRIIEPHRWPTALTMAGLTSAGSYLLFAVWLKVPLPSGLFAR
jgi:putative tricarboxylic transport membrane protein